jgi:hypothetical protein
MDKLALESLTQFCVDQHFHFDAQAWYSGERNERMIAVTARYLSMTSWYGMETELEAIAEALLPGISARQRLGNELHALALDIPYLSATIRYRIAKRRIAEASAPGFAPFARTSGHIHPIEDLPGPG